MKSIQFNTVCENLQEKFNILKINQKYNFISDIFYTFTNNKNLKGLKTLKTETHKILAEYLAFKYLADRSILENIAFKIGSIEPDYNPFSYLRGFFVRPFFGHGSDNCRKYLKSAAKRLKKQNSDGVWYMFKLGVFIHYLADSFTYSHNNGYGGGVKEHDRYERNLDVFYREKISLLDTKLPVLMSRGVNLRLGELIDAVHEKYKNMQHNPEKDLLFILYMTCLATKRLSAKRKVQKRYSPAKPILNE
jgi:hypothetical protein